MFFGQRIQEIAGIGDTVSQHAFFVPDVLLGTIHPASGEPHNFSVESAVCHFPLSLLLFSAAFLPYHLSLHFLERLCG